MNNFEMQQFFFENEAIGSLSINGKPWFIGKDVAKALGYSNATKAIRAHVDDEDKKFIPIFREEQNGLSGQNYNTIVINESGLYSLILRSQLSNVEPFKRWVTAEVLPSIRKTGGFISGEESMNEDELILKAMDMLEKKIALRKRIVDKGT